MGDTKSENEIKDENEASQFYVQGAHNSAPKMILGACWGARDRSPFLAKPGL